MSDAAMMEESPTTRIVGWLVRAGLVGMPEVAMLRGCCEQLVAAGVPLSRAAVVVDTLHPVLEGRQYIWRADSGEAEEFAVDHETGRGRLDEAWLRSPFFHVRRSGQPMMRRRLDSTGEPEFPIFDELRRSGHTDYLVCAHPFTEAGAIGEMDCVYGSWTTRSADGFADAEADAIGAVFPVLSLAIKARALQRIAGTLVETYLGRDAGRRVLSGRIERGVTERLRAVLWFSDLRGFTRITDTASPDAIIPFLNDYAGAIVSAIHDGGGDVLKLIGDGTLAVFRADDPADACRRALQVAGEVQAQVGAVSRRRREAGLPATEAYLGLHLGEVFYGNIGSSDRLDFTVIGPAVNMASRIAAMCRSVERHVLMSEAFVAAAPASDDIVSVGRFALRGFDGGQELFTLVSAGRSLS